MAKQRRWMLIPPSPPYSHLQCDQNQPTNQLRPLKRESNDPCLRLSHIRRRCGAVHLHSRSDVSVPHEPLLHSHRCGPQHRAMICVPEGMRADVADAALDCGFSKCPPDSCVGDRQRSDLHRRREHPIIRRQELGYPQWGMSKMVMVRRESAANRARDIEHLLQLDRPLKNNLPNSTIRFFN